MNAAAIGIAGELRVMSELMLRGHNPAKSYLDTGVDIVLESGLKIQVKTTASKHKTVNGNNHFYSVKNYTGGKNKRRVTQGGIFDFVIAFIPALLTDEKKDVFYIIPVTVFNEGTFTSICVTASCAGRSSKWTQFIDAWHLLREDT